MNLVRSAAFGLMSVCALAGCAKLEADPAPPAGSVDLPSAPPGATGALAAGRRTAPAPEDDDIPEDDNGEMPILPEPGMDPLAPAPPAESAEPGVNL